MKTPATKKPKCHVMVTLPPDVREDVESLAKQEDRPMAYICRQFIEQGIASKKPKNPRTEKF